MTEHGILLENIYNFGETGSVMGLTVTAKVIPEQNTNVRDQFYSQEPGVGNRD